MPTKAELQRELDDMTAEYQEFRKQVVRKALTAARRHGWCDEVIKTLRRLGLQEEIPTLFSVQWKNGRNWQDYATCLSTLRAARQSQHWTGRSGDPDPVRIVSIDGYGNLVRIHDECGRFGTEVTK